MRISVCEFLRLSTQDNWFYSQPGLWLNSDMSRQAIRENPEDEVIHLQNRKTKKHIKTLTYFRGENSHDVRAKARQELRRKYR